LPTEGIAALSHYITKRIVVNLLANLVKTHASLGQGLGQFAVNKVAICSKGAIEDS